MSGRSREAIRLRIEVPNPPNPALLRAAVAARLNGRPWHGPEAPVAEAIAVAVVRLRVRDLSSKDDRGGTAWPAWR
jgi:hypothetical protein